MAAISQYRLTNVLGTMYTEGNVVFTPDGTTLIAPMGNKITMYDLKNQKSKTLCFESTHNYSLLAVSHDGGLLVALNEIGVGHFINLGTCSLTRSIRLGKLGCLKFSPCGRYLAVGSDKTVFIYRVPNDESVGSEKPQLVRVFRDAAGLISKIDWSWNSKLIVVGSSESPMISVYAMEKYKNFRNSCFTSHREGVLEVCFEDWSYNIFSICRNGLLCKWECSLEPEEWQPFPKSTYKIKPDPDAEDEEEATRAKRLKEADTESKELTKFYLDSKVDLLKHRLEEGKRSYKSKIAVTCAELTDKREFAVVGFDDGVFMLVSLPSGELVQELRVTEHEVTTATFAPKGEWIAIGAGKVGQLLVYDWQAEDYVLKEQGHLDTIQCLDFSSDGLWIVTGAQDGKVKLWKTRNSFSFHTFSAHTSIVTGVLFMQNNRAVISSSLDGTVRAFDVKRDRNFRTFTSPIPTQFSGISIDSSSTYVAAGSVDTFNVYVWHLTSGRFLLEVTGHTAPISAISFSPKQGSSMMATISWDKTLRIRDSIETESNTQVVTLEAEGTALAFRPDGKEIAVAALNGSLTFFDPEEQKPLGSINCAHHMAARRLDSDGLRVNKNLEDLSFNAVAYSADGTWLLAGGKSVNLCMYNAEHQVIAHKLMLTRNRSLDGPSNAWTQKRSNEFGLIDMLEERGKGDELKLPGAKATSVNRSYKDIVQVYATKFSPTGQMWATATTEGVMLFTADSNRIFNPIGADTMISPKAIQEALKDKMYDVALHMALRLNIASTTTMVLEKIPHEHYVSIARALPSQQVKDCLHHLATILDDSKHIEFHMTFIKLLLQFHTHELMEDLDFMRPVMNAVKKAINARVREQSEISEQNKYLIEVAEVLENQRELEEMEATSVGNTNGIINAVKEEPMSDDDSEYEKWFRSTCSVR